MEDLFELKNLKVTELKVMAKSKGLRGINRMKKDELIHKLSIIYNLYDDKEESHPIIHRLLIAPKGKIRRLKRIEVRHSKKKITSDENLKDIIAKEATRIPSYHLYHNKLETIEMLIRSKDPNILRMELALPPEDKDEYYQYNLPSDLEEALRHYTYADLDFLRSVYCLKKEGGTKEGLIKLLFTTVDHTRLCQDLSYIKPFHDLNKESPLEIVDPEENGLNPLDFEFQEIEEKDYLSQLSDEILWSIIMYLTSVNLIHFSKVNKRIWLMCCEEEIQSSISRAPPEAGWPNLKWILQNDEELVRECDKGKPFICPSKRHLKFFQENLPNRILWIKCLVDLDAVSFICEHNRVEIFQIVKYSSCSPYARPLKTQSLYRLKSNYSVVPIGTHSTPIEYGCPSSYIPTGTYSFTLSTSIEYARKTTDVLTNVIFFPYRDRIAMAFLRKFKNIAFYYIPYPAVKLPVKIMWLENVIAYLSKLR